jgi:hypothetical protein
LAQATEVPVEAAANLGVCRGHRFFLRHDDIVEWSEFELPKRFSGQSAQAVPVDGAWRDASRDRETETSGRLLIELGQHREEAIGRSVSTAENT